MSKTSHIHLFEGYGIEFEYMIVRGDDLTLQPISDRILQNEAGNLTPELEFPLTCWSNELVLHVIELKSNGPTKNLRKLEHTLATDITKINAKLSGDGCRLLPTAMHPLMVPERDTKLWTHDDGRIYEAYHRIFDCRGHGWSNLQSVHINLPFYDEDEFGRLHGAIRLVLPLLPAIAASSPLVEGRLTGVMDNRLEFYKRNQRKVPSITGQVIPERAFTFAAYKEMIFDRIYGDISPYDPEGLLQYEWLNSRGAITRFDRHAIEIRVLDVQESPKADLALVALIVSTIRSLCDQNWSSLTSQQSFEMEPLKKIFDQCVKDGENATIANSHYLTCFGVEHKSTMTAAELWRHIFTNLVRRGAGQSHGYELGDYDGEIDALLARGTLATVMARRLGPEPPQARILDLYASLANCLATGTLFDGGN